MAAQEAAEQLFDKEYGLLVKNVKSRAPEAAADIPMFFRAPAKPKASTPDEDEGDEVEVEVEDEVEGAAPDEPGEPEPNGADVA